MTTFKAPVLGIVIPAKAGINFRLVYPTDPLSRFGQCLSFELSADL